MNDKKEKYEIDAVHVMGMILKRWWVVLILVVVCSLVAFGYTRFFAIPEYRSSATLLINGESSISSAYQQILAGQYQSKDYPYILGANDTLTEAAERLNKYDFPENDGVPYRKYTAGNINAMLSAEAVQDSRIFRINVKSTNPEEARLVAETVAIVFIERAEVLTSSDIGVVDNPVTASSPISRGYTRNTLIGFAMGLVLGIAVAIILGSVNDNIESEKWILESFADDIPLLAVIPDANTEHKGYYRSKYGYAGGYGYYAHNKKNKV